MSSPYKLLDLPSGCWAVTWDKPVISRRQVLALVFKEMRLQVATLGIKLVGGEMETLRIDWHTYWQSHDRVADMLSMYVVAGAVFDTEALARRFQQLAEQEYLLLVLRA